MTMTTPPDRFAGALGHVALQSEILEASQIISLVDGVINLLAKAGVAVDGGDTARASALIDRAEGRLPAIDAVPEEHRGGIVEAQHAIARLRERVAQPAAQA
jgi:hypothetical protein